MEAELKEMNVVPPFIVLNVITKTLPFTVEKLLMQTCCISSIIPYDEGSLITVQGDYEDWNNKLHVTNSFDWLCNVLCAAKE